MSITKLTTFDVVGAKADVSDIMSRISPEDTWYTSHIKKGRIHQVTHSYQEIALRDRNLNNAAPQGAQFVDQPNRVSVMRQTNTQIFTEVANVADTLQAVDNWGRADELAMQIEMRGAELKLDKEAIYLGGQAANLGSSVTGGRTPSIQAQIDPSLRYATGGANVTPTGELVKNVDKDLRAGGAKPTMVIVPHDDAEVPGTWAQSTSIQNVRHVNNTGSGASTINDYYDVFVTPTGRLDVVLSLNVLDTDYIVMNPKNHTDLTLRSWERVTLSKDSDATRIAIRGEFALKHDNYKASAVIRKTAGTDGKF